MPTPTLPPAWQPSLRPARDTDLRFLAAVDLHTLGRPSPLVEDAREQLNEISIVEGSGTALGMLAVRRCGDRWFIRRLYLLPRFRGRGIGAQLIEAVLAQARQNNARVAVSVMRDNRAIRLYERLGFSVTHECEFGYGMEAPR